MAVGSIDGMSMGGPSDREAARPRSSRIRSASKVIAGWPLASQ